jgi:hypothetical protein
VNRCVAFPVAVASDGSNTHEILSDSNGRPWLAGPAPEPPSTGATTVASTSRVDGLRGGSVDPNGQVHPIDGQGKNLEEEVSMRGQGRPERRDHPKDVTHRP